MRRNSKIIYTKYSESIVTHNNKKEYCKSSEQNRAEKGLRFVLLGYRKSLYNGGFSGG